MNFFKFYFLLFILPLTGFSAAYFITGDKVLPLLHSQEARDSYDDQLSYMQGQKILLKWMHYKATEKDKVEGVLFVVTDAEGLGQIYYVNDHFYGNKAKYFGSLSQDKTKTINDRLNQHFGDKAVINAERTFMDKTDTNYSSNEQPTKNCSGNNPSEELYFYNTDGEQVLLAYKKECRNIWANPSSQLDRIIRWLNGQRVLWNIR